MTDEINAVAYYRMSSDKQEASIDDQRTAVEEFAADERLQDRARVSATKVSAGGSRNSGKDSSSLSPMPNSGDFQAVLCWDQDRFSRFPVLEANHYWYLLDRAGVHLATVAQGRLNFEDLGEWLKASVVQHGKAEYIQDLARNTARGLLKLKLAGAGWLRTARLSTQWRPIGTRRRFGSRHYPTHLRHGGARVRFLQNRESAQCYGHPDGPRAGLAGNRHSARAQAACVHWQHGNRSACPGETCPRSRWHGNN